MTAINLHPTFTIITAAAAAATIIIIITEI